MTTLTVPSDLDQETLSRKGRESYDKVHDHIVSVATANKELIEGGEGPWVAPGSLTFKGAIFVDIHGRFLYPPGPQQGYVKFTADLFGIAALGGACAGFATFAVGRQELVGEVSCEINAAGIGPGLVEVNWWRGDKYIGTFVGGGLVEGLGIIWGKGKFALD